LSPVVALDRLSVARGGIVVIPGLSYAIATSGWIGLIGANGSGKTTLLRAIAGRLPIAGGRILLAGRDVTADRAARARMIGFAVDAAMLPAEITPREIFAIAAADPAAADHPALAPLRAALALDPILDRRCGTLSAGMGQRVALFAAFLDLPGIVILDEPFNWLDPLTAFDVKVCLRALVEAHDLTLISALHDVSTLIGYCHCGLLLADGAIALTMDEADLRAGLAEPVRFEARVVDRLRSSR